MPWHRCSWPNVGGITSTNRTNGASPNALARWSRWCSGGGSLGSCLAQGHAQYGGIDRRRPIVPTKAHSPESVDPLGAGRRRTELCYRPVPSPNPYKTGFHLSYSAMEPDPGPWHGLSTIQRAARE